ncbi:hypothetical protein PVAG01_09808 [Phlyctema vagabunda]|uniref:3'-5' exonuclease domain-containing protein n=1 Tax=Phlyctema vagabunda TaxID=108571 RepID=A0ABR4P454_9HELO
MDRRFQPFPTIIAAGATVLGDVKHIRVDRMSALEELLEELSQLQEGVLELQLDCEGIDLGKNGRVTDLELNFPTKNTTYLLDIVTLGQAAFDATSATGVSIRSILEDPRIPMGIFDCRNDSSGLFANHGIRMQNVVDLQILFLAASGPRSRQREFLPPLHEAINMIPITNGERRAWHERRKKGKLFCLAGGDGGQWHRFLDRPLHPVLEAYAAGDTHYMGHLALFLLSRPCMASEVLQDLVVRTSRARIADSLSPEYDPGDREHARTSVEFHQLDEALWDLPVLDG